MESFKWGSQFLTDIPEVDEQHYKLVSLLNRYGAALAENALEREIVDRTFGELAAYAREHFDTEEKLMASIPLDQRHIEHHSVGHRNFVDEVTILAKTIEPGKEEDYRLLLEFLIQWLAYHILRIDQVMARQIESVRNGTSPADAYQSEERELDDSSAPLLAALSGLFSQVSKRNKALVELNKTLEVRVEERTDELVRANRELEIISVTDHLTGLPNRRFAMRQMRLFINETIQNGEPLACLMIDADGFKDVNDSHGHDAGDVVLQKLSRELQHSVRSDDIVCRLGGDEFLVICPNTSQTGAMNIGEHIRTRIADLHVAAGDGFWRGSVSIGVGVSIPGLEDVDSLLKSADKAVYIAKKDGRNCVRSWNKTSS